MTVIDTSAICFAYALAMQRNCPLLYIGNDFSQPGIAGALP